MWININSDKYKYLVYTFISDVKVYLVNYNQHTGFNYDVLRDEATRFSEAEAHNLVDLAKRVHAKNLYLEQY